MSLEECFQFVTQCVLLLKGLVEEQETALDTVVTDAAKSKCMCDKAEAIVTQIQTLKVPFHRAYTTKSVESLMQLRNLLKDLQITLQENISQISTPSPAVIAESGFLVSKINDPEIFLQEVFTSMSKFVNILLGIDTCSAHASHTSIVGGAEEESIRCRVASLMSDCSQSCDEISSSIGSRKRKQMLMPKFTPSPNLSFSPVTNIRSRKAPSTSPTSTASPSKRPRCFLRPPPVSPNNLPSSPALELLETKKKGQRSGLYQWVLWREALRGEMDRRMSAITCQPAATSSPASPPASDLYLSDRTSWRRLSFS